MTGDPWQEIGGYTSGLKSHRRVAFKEMPMSVIGWSRSLALAALLCSLGLTACAEVEDYGDVPIVTFDNLNDGDTVASPVNICFGADGIEIEASGEINEGHGHHHVIIDPTDDERATFTTAGNPIPKDVEPRYVHLGDGSACKDVELAPGEHTLLAIIADGGHVTLDPPVYEDVTITVE
jgi:hypothetical protein